MRRWVSTIALIVVLTGAGSAATSCQQRTVAVKTGERVVCTYGEEVSNTVRTIKVPAKKAGEYSVKTTTVTCGKHQDMEAAYAAAQTALAKKDTATAKRELEKVVKVDATYRIARRQLDEIVAGKTPAPDTDANTTGGTPTPAPGTGSTGPTATPATPGSPGEDAPPTGPVASLTVYTPDSLSGFRPQDLAADAFAVSRMYLPSSSGRLNSLVIAAEQHRSEDAAERWLRDNVRRLYTQSARNVRIGGHDGYEATDGRRFAVVAWTEGPIVVALEADTDGRPVEVLDDLRNIASRIAQ